MNPSAPRFAAAIKIAGAIFVPVLWIAIKYGLGVSDRFLPSPISVITAVRDIEPSILVHLGYTTARLAIGFSLGIALGLAMALLSVRSQRLNWFLMPVIQSLRAVPSAAVVPFFLLWFGFSETGRYLLVITAVAFNLFIAAIQILREQSEAHRAFFLSFGQTPGRLLLDYSLPKIAETLLPTLRFSLALSIGAVTVSELLGSQVGLGYLIQTSRSTFSLHVLFLATIALGLLSAGSDLLLVSVWRRLVYWRVLA